MLYLGLDSPQHLESIDIGQSKVGENKIWADRRSLMDSFGPCGCDHRFVPRKNQCVAQVATKDGLIFHN